MNKRKHSILFVDDDPLIIRGIERFLDEFSENWDVDFASSGPEALQKISECAFDAIITDLRMPGMDGIQLMEIINREHPEVIRFVFSGTTSDVQILRSTHLVHQMIPKPCDMVQIYNTVERACRLRDTLSDPQLLRTVTGIKKLPSIPVLYNRLLKEIHSEDASMQVVGNIISQDVAMTAKILQLVNSAFFGLPGNVSSPQKAVAILGLNTIKALVLGIQIFSEYQGVSTSPKLVEAMWQHSLVVSNLAFQIATKLNFSQQDREYSRVSGVLHDIGKLMLITIPNFYQRIQFDKKGFILNETDYQLLGTSHAEMGAYLLGIWGLPGPVVEAVAFHHKPGGQVSTGVNPMVVLYIANGLVNMLSAGKQSYAEYLNLGYLEKFRVVISLDEWTLSAQDMMKKSL